MDQIMINNDHRDNDDNNSNNNNSDNDIDNIIIFLICAMKCLIKIQEGTKFKFMSYI